MPDQRPIGIFDSGVGGLTVLRALQHRLPHESTIYLGDLARCPYGPRPQAEVADFALQIADHLADQDIKLLVIACNTATAAAYELLAGRYPFPVIGVIDPGAAAALSATRNGKVGVIATDGTVASGAYRTSLLLRDPGVTVVQRSASWLVPIIERGALARGVIERELQPTLHDVCAEGIDTLILGCTHFPLIRDIFAANVGGNVTILDSAETTASEVAGILTRWGMLAGGHASHRLLVTGPAEAFAERAQAMFRSSPVLETIDLAPYFVS